jgi:hypothetical protein
MTLRLRWWCSAATQRGALMTTRPCARLDLDPLLWHMPAWGMQLVEEGVDGGLLLRLALWHFGATQTWKHGGAGCLRRAVGTISQVSAAWEAPCVALTVSSSPRIDMDTWGNADM